MNLDLKEMYEAPAAEVVEVRLEGVIAQSPGTEGNEGTPWGGVY